MDSFIGTNIVARREHREWTIIKKGHKGAWTTIIKGWRKGAWMAIVKDVVAQRRQLSSEGEEAYRRQLSRYKGATRLKDKREERCSEETGGGFFVFNYYFHFEEGGKR